ncbi:META domain-containing protein [Salinispirillum sp. LH 10-3-1]|uniref:META domain-containing protein n=1 Tax=Salinispirillum sp. LH 10-3-1 TaxID=2952525 RepID=A0AB38YJB1_9GAMM
MPWKNTVNRSSLNRIFLISLTLLLTACANRGLQPIGVSLSQPRAITVARASNVQIPALPNSYRGILSCDDCEGIDTQLDMLPDGRFWLHEVNLSTRHAQHDTGAWSINGNQLWLQGHNGAPIIYYALNDGGWLKSSADGNPQDARNGNELVDVGWRPRSSVIVGQGMLRQFAEQTVFTDCATGFDYAVTDKGQWAQVEDAYRRTRLNPTGAVLVNGPVQYEWVMAEDEQTHVVTFTELPDMKSGRTCGRTAVDLESSSWSLTHLAGIWDIDLENVARPTLEIQQSRLSGNTGCNAIAGEVVIDEQNFSVGPVASTRRMCASGMEIESAFLQALQNVAYASKEGQLWVWYDVNMNRLAAFKRD